MSYEIIHVVSRRVYMVFELFEQSKHYENRLRDRAANLFMKVLDEELSEKQISQDVYDYFLKEIEKTI